MCTCGAGGAGDAGGRGAGRRQDKDRGGGNGAQNGPNKNGVQHETGESGSLNGRVRRRSRSLSSSEMMAHALDFAKEHLAPSPATGGLEGGGRGGGRGSAVGGIGGIGGTGGGAGGAGGAVGAGGAGGGLSISHGEQLEQQRQLHRVMGLLAYTDPMSSPLCELMAVGRREVVADALNAAVLADAIRGEEGGGRRGGDCASGDGGSVLPPGQPMLATLIDQVRNQAIRAGRFFLVTLYPVTPLPGLPGLPGVCITVSPAAANHAWFNCRLRLLVFAF